mmetsp:Transcript_25648/g.42672  ORF Transcript_25648/g.42672 Transcript_25648/m.42672 type:complete len:191 (-) Transcript_25648:675-1247(-)|eukprot:CAMPEP_0119009966 /NCGR_PEP_ID=MMETSP1176-20130426/4707_1 /TAXON_ID=265551 /ORGANISM="Synedropsis recta cf, Strain CCMP1620" /LENGTH=190 /DNA_ID=CAMNT_0006962551 /DNA_START=54 /DNA_END=626 /DNA_ORIENTATION=+
MTSLHHPNLGRTATSRRRDEAGSLTLSAPPSSKATTTLSLSLEANNAMQEVNACGGNTQLMEARLCQMTSSIRALFQSNVALEEAIVFDKDPDFCQALEENKQTIRRQGQVAVALVRELQAHGCSIELESDLQQALMTSRTGGVEVSVAAAVGNNNGNTNNNNGGGATTTTTTEGEGNTTSTDFSDGIFL